MNTEFSEKLGEGLMRLDIDIQPQAFSHLQAYYNELWKWSRKINLIAKGTTPEQLIELHFLDSLTLLPQLSGAAVRLLDIGSGAGFPGLVCSAASDGLDVTLVEPRLKRVNFLRHLVRTIGLQTVAVLDCRIEDESRLPSNNSFTHITGRAVAELSSLLQMAARFSSTGPRLVWMKGPKWRDELNAAADILAESPYELTEVVEYRLPFSGAERNIIVFQAKEVVP